MSAYLPDVYVPPEPVMVINDRRRMLGPSVDPYYAQDFGPYSRGRLVSDVTLKAPIFSLRDIAIIKDALAVEGVYNVICDIPLQTVVVSTRLSPSTVVSLVREVMGDATLLSVMEPLTATAPIMPQSRYAYDDMYSYRPSSSSRYGAYYDPYGGRSYDNEFRPSRYYSGYSNY